eukprot:scaffold4973_cov135-Cylindrotheca_fusiformis.AAC.5
MLPQDVYSKAFLYIAVIGLENLMPSFYIPEFTDSHHRLTRNTSSYALFKRSSNLSGHRRGRMDEMGSLLTKWTINHGSITNSTMRC